MNHMDANTLFSHCREEVRDFAMVMENVLRENDHKGGWDKDSFLWLCTKLGEEVGEVSTILAKSPLEPPRVETMKEAADIGNIAMMIFDKASKQQES